MVYGGDMLSWNTDLDHLDIVRGKQHAMPDFRWLDHAIASMQAKFRPLILIYKINPASDAENQLKPDRVIMNHIRHRPTTGDADMAGYDRPAEPVGDQITIMTSPANHPGRLVDKLAYDIVMWVGG